MKAIAARVADENARIQPFRVTIPEAELVDLRRRIRATRWPERETISDASQGVQLAIMQDLASYWSTDYDWRVVESRLNTLPQFVTEIHGLDIHFIHARSTHKDALPLIVTHGWPGSVIHNLKIIDPLINPIAHLGKQASILRFQRREHSGRRECVSRRVLSNAAGLGKASVPEPHLFQQSRERRAFPSMGRAVTVFARTPRLLQIAAHLTIKAPRGRS